MNNTKMLSVTLISTHAKIAAASSAALVAMVGDAISPPNTWEDWTAKGFLVLAIGWLVRELGAARKEAKDEREAHAAEAKVREGVMTVAMHAQAQASQKVCDAINEQTDYFKAVARNLIERGMNTNSGASKLP